MLFLLPQLKDFDYYMRLDDTSEIQTKFTYNPFEFMVSTSINFHVTLHSLCSFPRRLEVVTGKRPSCRKRTGCCTRFEP